MSFLFSTIFELALVAAVFWGIFNEGRLIAFEKRLASAMRRRRLRVVEVPSKHTNSNRFVLY